MAKKQTIGIGALILVIMASAVYVTMDNAGLQMKIDKDKSTFYSFNDTTQKWDIVGTEYNKLLLNNKIQKVSSSAVNTVYDNNSITIVREAKINNSLIRDTYYYEGNVSNVEMFPISHKVEIFNASGMVYQYEVQKLVYDGPTQKITGNEMSFGRKMKVTWQPGYTEAKITKAGILTVKYLISNNNTTINVRLFDPEELSGQVPFIVDANTYALFHFDSSSGDKAIDETGRYNGTTINFPTNNSWTNVKTLPNFNNAFRQNLTTGYIGMPASTFMGRQNMTVEVWANFTWIGSLQYLFDSGNGGWRWMITPAGYQMIGLKTGSNPDVNYTSNTSLVNSTWYHIAFTYNATELNIFQNGELVGAFDPVDTIFNNAGNVRMFSGLSGLQVRGTFDDFRFSTTTIRNCFPTADPISLNTCGYYYTGRAPDINVSFGEGISGIQWRVPFDEGNTAYNVIPTGQTNEIGLFKVYNNGSSGVGNLLMKMNDSYANVFTTCSNDSAFDHYIVLNETWQSIDSNVSGLSQDMARIWCKRNYTTIPEKKVVGWDFNITI